MALQQTINCPYSVLCAIRHCPLRHPSGKLPRSFLEGTLNADPTCPGFFWHLCPKKGRCGLTHCTHLAYIMKFQTGPNRVTLHAVCDHRKCINKNQECNLKEDRCPYAHTACFPDRRWWIWFYDGRKNVLVEYLAMYHLV